MAWREAEARAQQGVRRLSGESAPLKRTLCLRRWNKASGRPLHRGTSSPSRPHGWASLVSLVDFIGSSET
eukprot:1398309-Karenia_brevis.AAC.1